MQILFLKRQKVIKGCHQDSGIDFFHDGALPIVTITAVLSADNASSHINNTVLYVALSLGLLALWEFRKWRRT